jgi:hypothetical protein
MENATSEPRGAAGGRFLGFEQIGLTRYRNCLLIALNNRASRRVAEKSGAMFGAVARTARRREIDRRGGLARSPAPP